MNMRLPPYLGRAVIAGLILLISVLAFRRYTPYVGGSLAPSQPPAVVLELRNAYFVGLNHKGKLWSLKAASVQIGRDRALTTLIGIKDGKIFESGKVALRMEAGRAVYNSYGGDLVLERGLTLFGGDGQKVTAQGASWNSATSSLRSTGKVRYESPWAKASVDHLLVDTKTKEMTMWNVDMTMDISRPEAEQHAF